MEVKGTAVEVLLKMKDMLLDTREREILVIQ